jgi:hypothetical protein
VVVDDDFVHDGGRGNAPKMGVRMPGYSAAEVFKPLVGEPAWDVSIGQGSFITLEFGHPHIRRTEPTAKVPKRIVRVGGDWHLFVYCCDWQILDADRVIATSDGSKEEMNAAAKFLDGQILVKATDTGLGTLFEFDLGGMILTSPSRDEADDQWLLYHGEQVYVCDAKAQIDLRDANSM